MTEIVSIISTVGFPIVSFLISSYFIKYTYDMQLQRDKENDKRNNENWKQLSELTIAVNYNSQSIQELIGEIHGKE